jgi:hypothetical protein
MAGDLYAKARVEAPPGAAFPSRALAERDKSGREE